MRARPLLPLAVLGLCASLLATGAHAKPAQQKGGTLRLSTVGDVDSVDPATAYSPESWMIEYATCAKLYNYPDKAAPTGTIPIPEVAAGFPTVSADGNTQTIRLKRTFRFNTGQPVRAANFVAAFNRDANPKLQSPATNYLHEFVGADAVIAGKAQAISGVKALGPYTLQVRTTGALPDLVSRLTMPFFCPISVNMPVTEIDEPLGSGPYYVASRVPNRQVVLERNPSYRGSRPANVDRVVITVGVSPDACQQAVEQNELDWCDFVSPAATNELATGYGVNKSRLFFNPTLETNYFAFNHDRPGFKGPGQIPLAKAINWALDRRALVAARSFLGAKRTDQVLPPAIGRDARIYPLGAVTEQRLVQARAFLARAKLKPTKLVLYTSNSAFGATAAQIFQFNMKRLGIDVEIEYFSLGTLFQKMGTRGEPFDIGFGVWQVDYADPVAYFGPMLNGNSLTERGNTNIAYFDRPRYNRAIERIERLSGAARRQAWADLDVEMMRDDPPWAPYLNLTQLEFVSKSLGCYVFQPVIGRLDIAAACKK